MRKILHVLLPLTLIAASPARAADVPVDFARDVLPIFQSECVECHGPQKQKAKLRLDEPSAALAKVISPRDPAHSELYRRVTLPQGDEDAMPNRGQRLAPAQVAVLRRWIEQGGAWPDGIRAKGHWAYEKPTRPAVPEVPPTFRVLSPIDAFVAARLQREGLAPSPEADRPTLLRRLALDLTGLPPSPADVDAFVADAAPDAYEKVIDRLLASPQFGVRWARPWLDYARYADSHGYQRDDFRDLWAYRDWVVDALNADLPFDQFTIKQLAGDLLPNPTTADLIATGFNRNAPTNVEAGSEPEETRVNQVLDRVNTVATVWLGATLECAQCHDHKYDPFTMRDYYGLFAFFNNTALEADRTNPKTPGSIQFAGPTMPVKDDKLDAERAALSAQLKELNAQIAAASKGTSTAPTAEHVLKITNFESLGCSSYETLPDGSILLAGDAPDRDTYTVTARTTLTGIRALKLEALADPSLPGNGPGRGDAQRPNFVLNTFSLDVTDAAGKTVPVKFTRATADFAQKNFPPDGAIDDNPKSAWAINPKFHQSHHAVFEIASPIGSADGVTLTFKLVQDFGGARTIGRLRLSAITGDPASAGATEPAALARLKAQKQQLDAKLLALKPPTTLVMRELPQPRETHLLLRGNYLTPGDVVTPATPAALPAMAAALPRNRLGLARWLVSRDNPLVARVTVNRFWAEIFGRGLVATPEDFGVRGDRPTHPELLDFLAVDFMDHGWSTKHALRTIVTSATYRQSARTTPQLLARDDQNQLLARGPRFRLDAEAIRDNALAIAGLLSLEHGGPPIHPFQPDGLWTKVGGQKYDYVVSPGEARYRRGLYVVWKRAAPYPSFVNFDANNRMACRVRRPRSNTPLQALTLLNDPVYVEAAMAFARRVLTDQPRAADAARVDHAFRLALARPPAPEESRILLDLLAAQRAAAKQDPSAAKKLIASFDLPTGVAADEFAAWYAVATAILNLDETITKG